MSLQKRHDRYRKPDGKEFAKIYHLGYPLDELFTDDELADKLVVARRRVIRSFYFATEVYRGKTQRTDNYVLGVGPKQKELVKHVIRDNWRPIVTAKDLPEMMSEFTPGQQELIARRAQQDVYAFQINSMCSRPLFEIYFDEAHGVWQMIQSAIDEYRLQNQHARHAVKFDLRPEHGMVRSQRIRRGRPAGVSTSLAGDRMVV